MKRQATVKKHFVAPACTTHIHTFGSQQHEMLRGDRENLRICLAECAHAVFLRAIFLGEKPRLNQFLVDACALW